MAKTNTTNPVPLVQCPCSKCGRPGQTRRPRPGFICVRCFSEQTLGRQLTKGDITVRYKHKRMTAKQLDAWADKQKF